MLSYICMYACAFVCVSDRICNVCAISCVNFSRAGSLQCQFVMDTIIEHVAKELNKDPSEVRKINLYQTGEANKYIFFVCT